MNQLIKELIEQAGGIGHDDDGNELTPALVGSGLEKFAELIVRECAGIASNPAPGCHSSFGKIILEHFGVEE